MSRVSPESDTKTGTEEGCVVRAKRNAEWNRLQRDKGFSGPFFSKPGCQYLMTRLVWGVTIAKHGLFKKNFTARAGFIV